MRVANCCACVVVLVAAFLLPATGGAAEPQVRLRDGAGREVGVPLEPRRIVSLAPSVTEMLFALSAGGRVVGITDFCDYPREAAGLPRIGGLIHPDLERIMALRPDLAIASTAGNYLEDAERLERLGVPVYTAASGSIEQTLQSFLSVGELLGMGPQARRLVEALRGRLAAVQKAAAARPRTPTLYVIEPDPLVVPGRGTFLEEALAVAGADLVTREAVSGWAQFDLERVVELRPQVILTASANAAWAATAGTRPIWKELPAVREGRVYVISDSIQHPGPRLVDGVEEVAALLSGEKEPGGRPPRP